MSDNITTYNNLDVLEQIRLLRKEIMDGNINFDNVTLDQIFENLIVSVNELNMLHGVTSLVQEQIDSIISGYDIKDNFDTIDELIELDKTQLKTGYAYTIKTDQNHENKHTLYKFNAITQEFEYYGIFELKVSDMGLSEDQLEKVNKLITTGEGDKLLANDGKYKDLHTLLQNILDDINPSKTKTYSSFTIEDKLTKLNNTITKLDAIKSLISDANIKLLSEANNNIDNSALTTLLTANEYTDGKIKEIDLFQIREVASLPTVDISPTTIYLIHRGEEATLNRLYEKWIYINGKWELMGVSSETRDFVTTEVFNQSIANFITEKDFKDLSDSDIDYMIQDIFNRGAMSPTQL